MAQNLSYNGSASTLTPSNFWILPGSNMFTKLMYHSAGGILRVDRSWAVKLRTLANSHCLHSVTQRSVKDSYQDWWTNWKGGTSLPSTRPTPSPCASLGLAEAPNMDRDTFHLLSISSPLCSQIRLATTFALKPGFQKKPRNTWILFSSWHIWRTKQHRMCSKGR